MIDLALPTAEQSDTFFPNDHVEIRRAVRTDLASLELYFNELSSSSLYRRLFATSHAIPALFYAFFEQQEAHSGSGQSQPLSGGTEITALLAINPNNIDDKHIIGEGMISIDRQAGEAEIALSLAEDQRRKKIGSALVSALIQIAQSADVGTVYADALRQNEPFIRLAQSHGFKKNRHPDDWSLIRLNRKT